MDKNLSFSTLRKLLSTDLFGFNFRRFILSIWNIPRFIKSMFTYRKKCVEYDKVKFHLRVKFLKPILTDFNGPAGIAKGHYFYQDLWAAKNIFQNRPKKHLDIGSRIDGFISHLLAMNIEVIVIDVRPLKSDVEGLRFMQMDATDLSPIPDNSVESLSSLHAIEHFGLGRYGDSIDPNAPYKAMYELVRILKPDGKLYFSVPIGVQRLYFNAHRIFAPQTILRVFSELNLISFAAVDDCGKYHIDVSPDDFIGENYACGLFLFAK